MEQKPTEVKDVAEDPSTALQVPPHLAELVDAVNLANAADPIEVVHPTNGKTVRHLNLRLSPAQTKRVMAMPAAQRAAMAEAILAERADAKRERETKEATEDAQRKSRRAKGKRAKRARRRNR